MPQILENKEYRTFVGGLISDANPTTFPENSSQDECNYDLNVKGERRRRKGLDIEYNGIPQNNSTYSEGELETVAISFHTWKNPGNTPNLDFGVLQLGALIYIFQMNITPIEYVYAEAIPITDVTLPWQSASVGGDLFLATGDYCVYRVSYDNVDESFHIEKHGLLVRDIWGIEDDYKDSQTFPYPLAGGGDNVNSNRVYNLLNQGWALRTTTDATDPILYEWITTNSYFPSSTTNASGAWATSPPDPDDSVVYPNSQNFVSPKGHYILDFFYRGRSRNLVTSGESLLDNFNSDDVQRWGNGISGSLKYILEEMSDTERESLEDTTESTNMSSAIFPLLTKYFNQDGVAVNDSGGGLRAIASFGSRLFYSGFTSSFIEKDNRSISASNVILFSQVITSKDKVGKCYQEGDPTSHDSFDIVDSDGGLIILSEADKIVKMMPLGEYLIVFCTNGIWAIGGGEAPFSATNYIVNKVSETSCVSDKSVVVAGDVAYFWAESGIYSLVADKATNALSISDITNRKLSQFYRNINQFAKANSKGVYDRVNKVVSWIYSDEPGYNGYSNRYRYNSQLNYNIELGSFYPYKFESITHEEGLSPAIIDFFPSSINVIRESEDYVYSQKELVTSNGLLVTTTVFTPSESLYPVKYVTLETRPGFPDQISIKFCDLNNDSFLDWESFNDEGVDAAAYLLTGDEILGDTQRQKQAIYLTTNFERTETGFDELNDYAAENPSGCLVTPYWDFSTSSSSGKVGTQFQAYRLNRWYVPADSSDTFDYGRSVISTKSKLRGRGKSLKLRFDTEPGKDCILYGWGIVFTGNQSV